MKIIQMQFVPQENTQYVGISGKIETNRQEPLLFGLSEDGHIYKQVISKKNPYLKDWELYILSDSNRMI